MSSIGSQLSGGQPSESSGQDTNDGDRVGSPLKGDSGDGTSTKPTSPLLTRASAMERRQASPASSRSTASPVAQRGSAGSTAASREIESLKAKLRVIENKRLEDREKLNNLEKVHADKERYESIVKMLQSKAQKQHEEISDLRRQLEESATRFEEIENIQAEHDIVLEMATLDREMAEEHAEFYKVENEALKEKTQEYELELEVLREENAELEGEMSPEEKASQGWLQMERENTRLRDAVVMLRDLTRQKELELNADVESLRKDLEEFDSVKENYELASAKVTHTEAIVEDLRQQLDAALGAEDMIGELAESKMTLEEEKMELEAKLEELEMLKDVSDELEINFVEDQKELLAELELRDSVISEQNRRAAEREEALEDMEYTLSRFRELVKGLQSDLEDMKASHEVTETESEKLNNRSRAMMDLNMKLQVSAAKTQVKTIDLELRRLDAQEASEHLAIVQLFLPDAFHSDRDSVLALLRFKRVGFKANILHGFVKERVTGQLPLGHEESIFSACDVLDKLSWVTAMCDRFVYAISHCSTEEFAKFEGALYELEPVERALNGWIDGLRRDELKEAQCASELQRTIALMSHLAEVHISVGLASYADEVHMRTLTMQSHLENAASAMSAVRIMVQTAVSSQGDEDEHAGHFARKTEAVIASTRSAKVVVGKTVRALEDLKSRSLSLTPDTIQTFEQCETATEELARFSRQVGSDLCTLLHEEGRTEPFTYLDVQTAVHGTTSSVFASVESDLFSTYSNKLRTLTGSLMDLAALASDLEMTQEFERAPAPWVLRSQELRSSKRVTVDVEEEMRRLKDDNHERARSIAMRDQTLEEASVKIELLESRMRDAAKKNERITELERRIEDAKRRESELTDSIEAQNKELTSLDADREQWKKVAEDVKARGIASPGSKDGQERAVATAREMEALKTEIASLQAAVRYLREDNRRARLRDSQGLDWLEEPLVKPISREEQRKSLVIAEGQEVLNELLNLTTKAQVYDLSTMPSNRLAWRPVKSTPQYHAAKQREDYEAWSSWKETVVKKANILAERDANRGVEKRQRGGHVAAKVSLRLPDLGIKRAGRGKEVEIVNPDDFEDFRGRFGFV